MLPLACCGKEGEPMQELYLQLQGLKRSDKYCLLLIFSLLFCFLVKIFAIDVLQNKIAATEALLRQEEQRLTAYQNFAAANSNYGAFLAEQQIAKQKAYQIIPQHVTAAELIREYTALAAKHNLRIESIKPVTDAKQAKTNYEALTFKISARGNFYKTAAFLDELQNGERLVSVSNVVLERAAEGANGEVLLTADLTAYALK